MSKAEEQSVQIPLLTDAIALIVLAEGARRPLARALTHVAGSRTDLARRAWSFWQRL